MLNKWFTTGGLAMLLAVFFLLALPGCSGQGGQIKDRIRAANDTNLKRVTRCYLLYQTLNYGRGPESMEKFKEFCVGNQNTKKHMDRLGIETDRFDDYLIGDGGESFQIVFGVNEPKSATDADPIVFELADGQYLIGYTDSSFLEVSQEEGEALLKAAMKPPKKG